MKKQFTSKVLIALLAMAGCVTLSAQTVVPVGATSTNTTIQAAYNAIKATAPITGAYVLELQSDYDATTEVFPITLTAINGASASNSITIKPAAGVSKTISAPVYVAASATTSDAASTGIKKFMGSIGALASGNKIYGLGVAASTTVSDITNGVVTLSAPLNSSSLGENRQGTTWVAFPASGTIISGATTIGANTNIATITDVAIYNQLAVGMLVGGNGIPYGTTITALSDATAKKITLSKNIGLGKSNASLYFVDAATGIQVTPTAFNIPVSDASAAKVGMFVAGTNVTNNPYISAIVGNDLFVSQVAGTFATGAVLTLTPTATIRLDGAQYVTIDGGIKANLIIDNANNNSNTIQFVNDASNNTIKNCTVKGLATSSPYGTGNIVIASSLVPVTGNDNNIVDNCDINGTMAAAVGINIAGTIMTTWNDNNTISNCNIFDFNTAAASSIYGISVNSQSSLTKVKDNQIYWTASMTPAVSNLYYGISVGGESNTISGNKVGYSDAVASTTITSTSTPRFVGILTAGGPSAVPTIVSGNTVANINLTTASGGDNWNVGYGMLAGIASDNSCTVTNTANRAYITISNNNVNNLILTSNLAPAGSTYWNAIGITSNVHFPTITGNTVHTISSVAGTTASGNKQAVRGINAVNGSVVGATISGNTIYNLTAGDITATSSGNQITALSCSSTLTDGNGSLVEKNLVYNIKALNSTNTAIAYGLQTYNNVTFTATAKDIILRNNVVRMGTDVSCNGSFFGYYPQAHGGSSTAAFSNVYFYNNTIYIAGTAASGTAATGNTACIYRPISSIGATMDFKNNILVNKRSGGITGVHAAILLKAATDYNGTTQFLTSNYNLFYLDAAAIVGGITTTAAGAPTATFATLDIWNNAVADATPGTTYDVNSVSGDPMFVDVTAATPDMHITSPASPANQSGVALASVTDDFSGLVRADYTPNDMGAYVIVGSTAVETPKTSGLSVYAVNKALVFDNLSGQTARIYTANGQLIKSMTLSSDKVSVPTAVGFYIVKVGTQNTKVLVK